MKKENRLPQKIQFSWVGGFWLWGYATLQLALPPVIGTNADRDDVDRIYYHHRDLRRNGDVSLKYDENFSDHDVGEGGKKESDRTTYDSYDESQYCVQKHQLSFRHIEPPSIQRLAVIFKVVKIIGR
jgi:hypothetical protein